MKIGEMVRRNIPAIFEYCERQDPAELNNLQDSEFSKRTFDINYPFCKPVHAISATEHVRYYTQEYVVCGTDVRVTSQWFNPPISGSLPLLVHYLENHGITLDGLVVVVPEPAEKKPVPTRPVRARYKGNAIGNAQNHLIRNILSRLGDETFGAGDWKDTVAAFGNQCAYCGSEGALVKDHVIPINKQALGEHRLGNLVPACRSCNSKKAGRDYRDVLADDPTRLAAIALHLEKHGYTPIGDQQRLRQIIAMAHQELRQMADRYVAIINTVVASEADESELVQQANKGSDWS